MILLMLAHLQFSGFIGTAGIEPATAIKNRQGLFFTEYL